MKALSIKIITSILASLIFVLMPATIIQADESSEAKGEIVVVFHAIMFKYAIK